MSSYVIWANKGGIGKSTMSFQLAAATARANPKKKVIVIDLSPQCDVSRMMLGGGHFGGENKILDIMLSNPRKTIQSYLSDCSNDVPTGMGWPDPWNYIVEPNTVRDPKAPKLPENLRLLCGDFDLERTIQTIEKLPQPTRRSGRVPTGAHYSIYLLTRSFLRHAVDLLTQKNDNIVIIDTDPYFNVITTQMGLVAADNWVTAYSPTSQASQYAVLRSIEFMFEPASGLQRYIDDEKAQFSQPWFDNRGNPLTAPVIDVAKPYLLLANMANPYSAKGAKPYTKPQKLHQQAMSKVEADTATDASTYGVKNFKHSNHMWDIRRLGLICDYNGVELHTLKIGDSYAAPAATRRYTLSTSGGTPVQLAGYQTRLTTVAKVF